MPTYEYHCQDCGKEFEQVERLLEHGKSQCACPGCGGRNIEQRMSMFAAKTSRKS